MEARNPAELVITVSLIATFIRAVLQNATAITDATATKTDDVWRVRLLRAVDLVLNLVSFGPTNLLLPHKRRATDNERTSTP